LVSAIQALGKARAGVPAEADHPPVTVLPGKKPKLLPGQTDIFGGEYCSPVFEPDEEEEAIE
jgi:hypothetical protein